MVNSRSSFSPVSSAGVMSSLSLSVPYASDPRPGWWSGMVLVAAGGTSRVSVFPIGPELG